MISLNSPCFPFISNEFVLHYLFFGGVGGIVFNLSINGSARLFPLQKKDYATVDCYWKEKLVGFI